MAQKVILVDDLDGSERDVTTIQFSVAGDTYEIDLSPPNLTKLRQAVRPFTAAARRVGGEQQPPTGKGRRESDGRAARMRAWAKNNGFDVPAFGRIPRAVVEAYHEAHGRDIYNSARRDRVGSVVGLASLRQPADGGDDLPDDLPEEVG